MKYSTIVSYLGVIVLCAGAAALAPVTRGGFDLSWNTIDSGGGTSTGGDFALSGTIGQHDSGGQLTGGDYEFVGGFWTVAGDVINTCPADITGDNIVDVSDLLEVIAAWGPCPSCDADINGDNVVDVVDLLELIAAWGACP